MAKKELQKNVNKDLGLVVVGNALVDMLAKVDERFITKHAMNKGKMTLISKEKGDQLYAEMDDVKKMSGGSGANSLAVFASFGGKGGFIGKTSGDDLGDAFRQDLRAQNIESNTVSYAGNEGTGRSYIFITPDGERTMNTYLGASTELEPADIEPNLIKRAKILLLEGYLFDKPKAKQAFMLAAKIARSEGVKVAFTLSDPGCVNRHHDDFKELCENYVDILIGNEKEAKALTLKDTFDEAVRVASAMCDTVVFTKGKHGAVIVDNDKHYHIDAVAPEELVDTTGAGDAFAGGVLYGLAEGMSLDMAGHLGAKAASKTISHVGARNPDVRFSELLP